MAAIYWQSFHNWWLLARTQGEGGIVTLHLTIGCNMSEVPVLFVGCCKGLMSWVVGCPVIYSFVHSSPHYILWCSHAPSALPSGYGMVFHIFLPSEGRKGVPGKTSFRYGFFSGMHLQYFKRILWSEGSRGSKVTTFIGLLVCLCFSTCLGAWAFGMVLAWLVAASTIPGW